MAALVVNNDFGKLYDASFGRAVAQSPELKDRIDYKTETIEPSAPTITDPMTTLASKNPDMFIAMTAGTAVHPGDHRGRPERHERERQVPVPAGDLRRARAFVKKDKVGGDGSAANDWWIVNPGTKDLTDAAFANDAYVKWARSSCRSSRHRPRQLEPALGRPDPGLGRSSSR